MKKLLTKLGFIKREMTLDEYIVSIRPKRRELSNLSVTAKLKEENSDKDNGPEEADCLVLA